MQTQANSKDTDLRDQELDEELAGVLTAISVVSKRLAKKLTQLSRQHATNEEGGKSDDQDE
jgi:hypothetical protein